MWLGFQSLKRNLGKAQHFQFDISFVQATWFLGVTAYPIL